jgi:hypothetical protein
VPTCRRQCLSGSWWRYVLQLPALLNAIHVLDVAVATATQQWAPHCCSCTNGNKNHQAHKRSEARHHHYGLLRTCVCFASLVLPWSFVILFADDQRRWGVQEAPLPCHNRISSCHHSLCSHSSSPGSLGFHSWRLWGHQELAAGPCSCTPTGRLGSGRSGDGSRSVGCTWQCGGWGRWLQSHRVAGGLLYSCAEGPGQFVGGVCGWPAGLLQQYTRACVFPCAMAANSMMQHEGLSSPCH